MLHIASYNTRADFYANVSMPSTHKDVCAFLGTPARAGSKQCTLPRALDSHTSRQFNEASQYGGKTGLTILVAFPSMTGLWETASFFVRYRVLFR